MRKIRNHCELFILYCVVGWLYEVIWCNIIENNLGFENRGFLFGPWLPIYGIGMTVVMIVFEKFKIKTPLKMFVVGAGVACIAELIGSYISEMLTGKVMWDYSNDFLNFQGRIALRPELYFGFLILFGLYAIRPKFIELQEKYDNPIRNIISFIIILLFVIDLVLRVWG